MLTINTQQLYFLKNGKSSVKYRVNGDEAVIIGMYDAEVVIIRYISDEYIQDNIETHISRESLYNMYKLSYSLSVHASQGSQYENIIYILDNDYMLKKEVVFTAISRAKTRCFVISNIQKFMKVQKFKSNNPTIFMKEFEEYEIV